RPPRSTLFPYTTLFRSSDVMAPVPVTTTRVPFTIRQAPRRPSEGKRRPRTVHYHNPAAARSCRYTTDPPRPHRAAPSAGQPRARSEEHTSELQSLAYLV